MQIKCEKTPTPDMNARSAVSLNEKGGKRTPQQLQEVRAVWRAGAEGLNVLPALVTHYSGPTPGVFVIIRETD